MLKMLLILFSYLFFAKKIKNLIFISSMMIFSFMTFYSPSKISNFSFNLALDPISYLLILLNFFIFLLMYLSSNQIWETKDKTFNYFFLLVMMKMVLFLTFSSMNLLFFFLWFEIILIPMFMLILGWGNQSERFNAAIYLLFYTLCGSLPLLLSLLMLFHQTSSHFMMSSMLELEFYSLWYLAFLMGFLIKLPLYFLHYWLPKAHVEAPITGSMLLAGLLLKLGSYGIYRMYFFLNKSFMNNYLISIALIGGMLCSFLCLRQIDIKSLIAYASIGHMGILLAGFLTLNTLGYQGGILIMISHGLCSSGLFCLMNFFYERVSSRNLLLLRGFMLMSPSLMFWNFMMLSSNMSAPPSLNLAGEILLISSLFFYHYSSLIWLIMSFLLTGAYSLFLYVTLSSGNYWNLNKISPLTLREQLLMFLHWFPLNFLILMM